MLRLYTYCMEEENHAAAMMSSLGRKGQILAAGSAAYREYVTAEILSGHATAEAIGLSATDFYTLNVLALSGPLTAGRLAQRTGLTTGATTRMIDRLESEGFVRRLPDRTDRRRVIVETLPDRDADIDAALQPVRLAMFEVFKQFDADQLQVIFDYFAAATPALVAAIEKLRRKGTDGGGGSPQ
jgi:DNA-binding MarR family transcriptional regulator